MSFWGRFKEKVKDFFDRNRFRERARIKEKQRRRWEDWNGSLRAYREGIKCAETFIELEFERKRVFAEIDRISREVDRVRAPVEGLFSLGIQQNCRNLDVFREIGSRWEAASILSEKIPEKQARFDRVDSDLNRLIGRFAIAKKQRFGESFTKGFYEYLDACKLSREIRFI